MNLKVFRLSSAVYDFLLEIIIFHAKMLAYN